MVREWHLKINTKIPIIKYFIFFERLIEGMNIILTIFKETKKGAKISGQKQIFII